MLERVQIWVDTSFHSAGTLADAGAGARLRAVERLVRGSTADDLPLARLVAEGPDHLVVDAGSHGCSGPGVSSPPSIHLRRGMP